MHLSQNERDILIKGMEEMMTKAVQEIDQSQAMYLEKTNHPSKALFEQKTNIKKLADSFLAQTKKSPWVF